MTPLLEVLHLINVLPKNTSLLRIYTESGYRGTTITQIIDILNKMIMQLLKELLRGSSYQCVACRTDFRLDK